MTLNPLERFGDRVGYYIRYRPRYPPAVLSFLQAGGQVRFEYDAGIYYGRLP